MSLRAELVRMGTRLMLKSRGHDERVEETRRRLKAMEALTPKPPGDTRIVTVDAGGVPADLVTTPASHPDRTVLYLHGGAYRAGSRTNYRHVTWRIADKIRARVVAI